MAIEKKVKNSTIRLVKDDLTKMEVQSFVFYANPDLKLGSGYGTAISIRGGPKIQQELDTLGPLTTTEVIITGAGKLPADHIIHAVGPRFQEENIPDKLRTTIFNLLKEADKYSIKQIAMPPMGTGFFGIPFDESAKITLEAIKSYLDGESQISEIILCVTDNRDYRFFQSNIENFFN